jgi:DNA-binding winged helix-turn-helix (wHTH) protein
MDSRAGGSVSAPGLGCVYEFGDFRLDCGRFELLRKSHPVRIERKPMELLILLAAREGQLVTRSEIALHLWSGEVFVDTEHGINTAIRKLRQVLRDDPEDPKFIQTVIGMGYRFIAPIMEIEKGIEKPAMEVKSPLLPLDSSKAVPTLRSGADK